MLVGKNSNQEILSQRMSQSIVYWGATSRDPNVSLIVDWEKHKIQKDLKQVEHPH